MGKSLNYKHFKNVDDMLSFADRDLEKFNNFEFEISNSIYRIESLSEIEKVNEYEFICENTLLDSREVEPCC